MKKKIILCVSVMENWGGGEEILLNLAKHEMNYEFIIASAEGRAFNIFKKNKLNVIPVKSLKKYFKSNETWICKNSLQILINIFSSFGKFIQLIFTKKADILLANGNFACLYLLVPSFITHKSLVVIQHLIYPVPSFEAKIVKIISYFADKIICVSKSVYNNQQEIIKVNKNKIAIVPNAVNTSKNLNIKLKDVDLDYPIRFGIIGSVIKLKGIHLILSVFNEILINNKNIHLHIIGTIPGDENSEKYYKELTNFVSNNRLNSNIHFDNYINSKEEIYSNLDIVVNYSLIPESFSLTVLEAMSFGKIIIAPNLGGPSEIIKNGFNGYLIAPNDIEELKNAVNYCILNFGSSELNKIRLNAIETVNEKYNFDDFISNYEKEFNSLL